MPSETTWTSPLRSTGSARALHRCADNPDPLPNISIHAALPKTHGDPNGGPKTPQMWLNASAFRRLDLAATPAGVYGTEGRNVVEGPGLAQWDLSAFKNIRVAESKNLQFRAEFFNLFNRANFRLPNGDISSPTFGQIQRALEPRLVQFALKF